MKITTKKVLILSFALVILSIAATLVDTFFHRGQGIMYFLLGVILFLLIVLAGKVKKAAIALHRTLIRYKVALENLFQSKEKYRVMIESISDAFMALDKNWRYTYVNRHGGKMVNRNLNR